MSKSLVLAEKPSVARDLARVLACRSQGNGYIEGEKYIVTWALGHLVTLADPEVYDDKYKTWRLEDLPMLPTPLKLVVIKETNRQYSIVREQMSRKDVAEIVLATDAGREGELVGRWIIEKAQISKPVRRLWISSVTDKAIQEGFARLRPGKEFENLYASAVARSEADWLVGINATRALTCKHNAQLSCGRVQTPTLAMIAAREAEIQNFKPRSFYGIAALADNLKLTWQDGKTRETRTFDRNYCAQVLRSLQGKNAAVTEVEKTAKKTYPPMLYDLTELQRDANRLYNFSAKDTLSYMQALYERHKLLTYPRTDSRCLSSDLVETLPERVKACGVGPYAKLAVKILRSPIRPGKPMVDDSKVTDHHAIIPTEEGPVFTNLDDKERKIYDLVVKRFLAALYPPMEYEQTTIKAKIGFELFIARGKVITALGWQEVYGKTLDEDEGEEGIGEQILPPVRPGEKLMITAIKETSGQTKPPAPFNEATLLSAMENPAKYLTGASQSLLASLEEAGGLGTVATRADIIEKLFNNFAIEKKGKDILITSKGRQLLELVPEELKSPLLTAQWEQKLSAIQKGTLPKNAFLAEIRTYAQRAVNEIKNSAAKFRHDNLTRVKCPDCGKYMLEVTGKKGKMLVCQDRSCGHRQNLSLSTNARCPNCHKRMDLLGEGEGQIFVCSCGYREKLAAFTERRKKEESGVSKRDVASYLREQERGERGPTNPALAEALAKLKLK